MLESIAPNPRYRLYASRRGYIEFVKDVLSGRLHSGTDTEVLESRLCDFFGVAHAVCTPMCRMGIYHAVKYSITAERKRVLMSPYTIADVVNMVINAGGEPVFVDIEAESCNINPAEVEKLIDKQTASVLVTHLHGIAANIAPIRSLCDQFGALLLEDTAQAFGARLNGQNLGAIGGAGVLSFGTYKNINGWYGGAVVSDNKALIDSVRDEVDRYAYQSAGFLAKRILKGCLTDIATSPVLFSLMTYWVFRFGHLNHIRWINKFVETELDLSRHDRLPEHYLRQMTPFQSRFVMSQIDVVDEDSENRIAKAELYYQGLKHIEELTIPTVGEGGSRIFTYYPVQYKKRGELLRFFMQEKRDVAAQHLKCCADLPAFSRFYRDCPVARKTAAEVILLPTYPSYSLQQVHRNIQVMNDFFR
ncbi:MAG: DegT/DnrJ/EryC1/StrS family aminotransferase [Mariprofundaceae bacterium]